MFQSWFCPISALTFDTVDHRILLYRLENWVGLSGAVLNWFRSYLEGRSYCVVIGSYESERLAMTCEVPHGSILGPLMFNLYMLPLGQILHNFNSNYHSYADDTQLYVSLSPGECSPTEVLCQCLEEINTWMRDNFLQLNYDKTEIILFGSKEKRVSSGKYLETRVLQSLTKL